MYFNKEEDLKTSLVLQNSLTDVVAMLEKASKVLKGYDNTVSSTAGGIMLSVTGKRPWTAITTDKQFRTVIEDLDVKFLYFRIADMDEWKSDGEEYKFDHTIFQGDKVSQAASV
jgi:hypothetical protein